MNRSPEGDENMEHQFSVGVIARVAAHESMIGAGAVHGAPERRKTPFGTSNWIHPMEVEGIPFALISRHGERGYETAAPWVNDRANLWALKDLGVEKIVSFSSPGSLDPAIHAGDLVLPDDVLDERRSGPHSFFEGQGVGVIRMDRPFCTGLAARFEEALQGGGWRPRSGGVYVGTQGPRLETPAEIRKYRQAGGNLVGMTLVPEVFLARELELCYAALCLVVNQAEGLREAPYVEGVLFEGLADDEEFDKVRDKEEKVGPLLKSLIRVAAGYERHCSCGKALERYRKRGDLGKNWRDWWA
jgi:5'-methylthioadenosine phosphorylase